MSILLAVSTTQPVQFIYTPRLKPVPWAAEFVGA
jgi:hypothetical protein